MCNLFVPEFVCESEVHIFHSHKGGAMDSKTQVMVALGAAIGVNCIPCFDHLYGKAKGVGLGDDDIRDIILTAYKVKNGASTFLKHAIDEQVGIVDNDEQPCCTPETNCTC